ncbi:LysM peptidoglycan-binding domain-containing protein [Streptomyces sp. NPDC001020]
MCNEHRPGTSTGRAAASARSTISGGRGGATTASHTRADAPRLGGSRGLGGENYGGAPAASGTAAATRPSPAPASTRSASPKQRSKAPERSTGHTGRRAAHGDYTVRSDDTLSGIAERHGSTWQRLYVRNRAVIGGDPGLIMPGQRLDVQGA